LATIVIFPEIKIPHLSKV